MFFTFALFVQFRLKVYRRNNFFSQFLPKLQDVLDQINIPLQTEEVHWLSFSPIEEHFYRRQHIECSREAAAKIRRMPNLDAR